MEDSVANNFIEGIGIPLSNEETGIEFSSFVQQYGWGGLQKKIGSGYYKKGFLYLFGKQLSHLKPCIDAWCFALDSSKTYLPVGVNKFGAILLAVNFEDDGFASQIILLDPIEGSTWEHPQVVFMNMIGNYLPTNSLSSFTSDKFYKAYKVVVEEPLEFMEILAIKVPLSLGGKIEASNFQIENILDYYKTTGEIYSKYLKNEEE